MRRKRWYKLDNVGKFYSSIADGHSQNIFRFSITLKDEIDESILQEALNETVEVFPNFNVNLKRGLFWYYLDETDKKYIVTKENLPICFRLYNNSNDFLYRVSYYKTRINFEISHILSDGRGGVDFFKTLIYNYVKLKYNLDNIDTSTSTSYIEKEEDSFLKYYKKTKSDVNDDSSSGKVYYYRARKLKNSTRYLEVHTSLGEVMKLSHNYNVTLTTFLVAILIYSFKDVLSENDLKKSIKIDIPVDLRKYFKSSSSKNYFGLLFIVYKFNSRNDSLEDVISEVSKQFKDKLTPKYLSIRVNKMVSFEKNVFCRVVPIFVKNIALKIIDLFTSRMSTSCVSNLGKISFREEVLEYIRNVNVLTSTKNFQFTLCSFNDDLSIGISSRYKYNDVIKNFCNYFSNQGIDMLINVSEVN